MKELNRQIGPFGDERFRSAPSGRTEPETWEIRDRRLDWISCSRLQTIQIEILCHVGFLRTMTEEARGF